MSKKMKAPHYMRQINQMVARGVFAASLLPICLFGFDINDPFDVTKGTKSIESYTTLSCEKIDLSKSMGLVELSNYALCNNPDTKEAWINALYQAEQVGLAKSAYLPNIDASASLGGTRSDAKSGNSFVNTQNGSINFSYLLYDFGARSANLANATKLLDAANALQNSKIQSTFLSVIQAYYNLFAAKASLEAYTEAQRLAKESYEAAATKYQVGVATPADKLQALTSYSQAILNTVKAEGTLKNAQGTLSNILGLDANTALSVSTPSTDVVLGDFAGNVKEMIDEAKKRRPDLVAAEAQIEAAKAGIDSAKAAGRPTVSLTSSVGYTNTSISPDRTKNASVGVALNIPIFSGFNTTYKVRTAQEQAKLKELEYVKLEKQVALDVFQAYNNLITQTNSLKASKDLLASAKQSMKTADGRYRAGVGSMIDLLTAQSALASAQQQSVEAVYNWYIAKATLAQSMGRLNFEKIEKISGGK